MIQQVLQDFGLSDNEVKVYLALLPMAKASSSTIGTRAGLSRNTVRNVVRCLVKRGLAHEVTEGNTNFYRAESPDKLLFLLGQEERKLKKTTEDMNRSLSKLKAIWNPSTVLPKVRFYEGIEGVKKVYEDTLLEGETIYAFQNIDKMDPEVKKHLLDSKYVSRRKEAEIFAYVITPDTKEHQEVRKIDEKRFRETKFLAQELFPMEVEINIYGNKIAFMSYNKSEMFGTIIESSAISQSMKAVFDNCWKQAQ